MKAIRWATDRIGDDGIVAFVTNNSFVDDLAFDGMRKHLAQDFDAIYVLDLGGNVRKNPKLSGTTHNVFGIQVGVSINFLVRRKSADGGAGTAVIYYARVDEDWRKEQKYDFLDERARRLRNVEWRRFSPTRQHTWLTAGLQDEFETFLPLGTKESESGRRSEAVFANFSNGAADEPRCMGLQLQREHALDENVKRFIETYNDRG